jgi:hypothetical protein
MMFRGAYETRFYRALHDALHLEVEYLNGRAREEVNETELAAAWRKVETLEKTSANSQATARWTCC